MNHQAEQVEVEWAEDEIEDGADSRRARVKHAIRLEPGRERMTWGRPTLFSKP
jgi:hypothetical protein